MLEIHMVRCCPCPCVLRITLFLYRRGEEHSFILKPAIMSSRNRRTNSDAPPTLSLPKTNGAAINASVPRVSDPSIALTDQYAVLVSYRCNYTGELLDNKSMCSRTSVGLKF